MKHIILVGSQSGEDYLADLIVGSLLFDRSVVIHATYIPSYLFDDFPESISLYGRGFTAFRCVMAAARKRVSYYSSTQSLINLAKNSDFPILVSSVWRTQDTLIELLIQDPSIRPRLVFVDGEDHTDIYPNIPLSRYFKRELLDGCSLSNIYPISFLLHPVVCPYLTSGPSYLPLKQSFLAPCDPRNRSSYTFDSQATFYQQYADSYFAITMKKGGWDCLRHYEIIANHCLPVFIDIDDMPRNTISNYPRDLQLEINDLFLRNVSSKYYGSHSFNLNYSRLMTQLMEHFYSEMLSTKYKKLLFGHLWPSM